MSNNQDQPGGRTGPVIALVLAAVAVLLAVASLFIALTGDRDDGGDSAAPVATTTGDAATTGPGRAAPPGTRDGTASATTTPVSNRFGYQPLWPFASEAEAAAWQQSYREGGHQPWHLDPAAVALSFTRNYLGFDNVDRTFQVTAKDQEAWVTVGYDNPNGAPATAAVLHLARLGTGEDAPWEVVGSEDRSTFTLTTPRYGTQVGSPLTVGGRITGVDESLDIRLLQLPQGRTVGEIGRIPAGGTDSPWTATLPFTASCPGALTLVVATGGHVEDVERFAITGVRC